MIRMTGMKDIHKRNYGKQSRMKKIKAHFERNRDVWEMIAQVAIIVFVGYPLMIFFLTF